MKSAENIPPHKELPVRHYSSDNKMSGVRVIFKSIFMEFPAAHSLGLRFVQRNIKAKYRQSFLGILWSFLPPITTAIVWIVLNKTNIVKFQDVGVPYPLFVITGTVLWTTFTGSLMMPMQVMNANQGLLVKINFPREALLVNAFYEVLFNSAFSFIIIIAGIIYFQIHISFESLLFIPAFVLLAVFGIALGLLILPFAMLFKDIQFILPTVLQFAMYLTPVIYPRPVYSGIAKILKLNPVSPLLINARAWLLGLHDVFPMWQVLAVGSGAIILLLIGIFVQRIVIEMLIERMGS